MTRAAPLPAGTPTLVAACLSAALLGGALLALVLVRGAAVETGYRVHDLRSEHARLLEEKKALELERALLLRPARLEGMLPALGLVQVEARHVVSPRGLP